MREFRAIVTALVAIAALSVGAHAGAAEKKALIGGRLIDGLLGPPVADSVILIDGDVIEAVGTTQTLPVPPDYEQISTEGMSVLPGLWDMHVHLMINGHSDYGHWDKTYPDRFATEIMPASAQQLLLAGVTTARDLGAPLDDSLAVRARIESGEIPGPRLFVSGPFIQHLAYPGTEAFRWGVNGARDARAKVKELADAGVDGAAGLAGESGCGAVGGALRGAGAGDGTSVRRVGASGTGEDDAVDEQSVFPPLNEFDDAALE